MKIFFQIKDVRILLFLGQHSTIKLDIIIYKYLQFFIIGTCIFFFIGTYMFSL